ncbi:unnamed protein product [Prorocentrum cordatum]|uniref:2'-phosphotransferase n=1 Tax=Prorocentrum cordatum TaxID=2364126 RepID=A0ABN9TB75_9DINO|nr:unnamed protein product [Polarella glacialis]
MAAPPWCAAAGQPQRPRRSAAERRAQARRKQARAAQELLRAFRDLGHRGCRPTRLGKALAEALGAVAPSGSAPLAAGSGGNGADWDPDGAAAAPARPDLTGQAAARALHEATEHAEPQAGLAAQGPDAGWAPTQAAPSSAPPPWTPPPWMQQPWEPPTPTAPPRDEQSRTMDALSGEYGERSTLRRRRGTPVPSRAQSVGSSSCPSAESAVEKDKGAEAFEEAEAPEERAALGTASSRPEEHAAMAGMLEQGVVRVLADRMAAGRGPATLANLEEDFEAQWRLPLDVRHVGEADIVTFLTNWPNRVEIVRGPDGAYVVQLVPQFATGRPR